MPLIKRTLIHDEFVEIRVLWEFLFRFFCLFVFVLFCFLMIFFIPRYIILEIKSADS